MKVYADRLGGHLKDGIAPIYIVSGDEPLLVQEACDQIRIALRDKGFNERDLHHAENNFDWTELLQSAGSMSLFATQKLIEVRLPGGKPGDAGSKVLQELSSQLDAETVLLLVLPRVDQRTQKTKWFSSLESAGVLVQVWPIEGKDLLKWLDARFRQAGLQASPDAVKSMAARIEGNLLAAVQEIERIRLTAVDGKVDADDVREGVADNARYDVFKLIDTALAGHAGRAIRMCNGLRAEGVEVLFLVNMFCRELRGLAEMKHEISQGVSMNQVLKKGRVWDKRKTPVTRCLERHDAATLQALTVEAGRIDRMVKGIEVGDPWRALQNLVLGITGSLVLSA